MVCEIRIKIVVPGTFLILAWSVGWYGRDIHKFTLARLDLKFTPNNACADQPNNHASTHSHRANKSSWSACRQQQDPTKIAYAAYRHFPERHTQCVFALPAAHGTPNRHHTTTSQVGNIDNRNRWLQPQSWKYDSGTSKSSKCCRFVTTWPVD